ncbi:hypothetical protein TSUD_240290 [Trifolium subterraneum]|uniref:Uncharacterized protein n=1 Tax=Trifolium subterraneum TaxID=3900 RepID=A0A2Z6P6D4_TRISU|nr:hypothetical protein TSUD_240290 [Trifolium subterraneum]
MKASLLSRTSLQRVATLKRTKSKATKANSPALRPSKPRTESRFGSKGYSLRERRSAQQASAAKMQVSSCL